ncbi:MAG: hypothetical protein B7Y47_03105 [Sphingomonas sp. 28-63-12]|nr:MAG: hypothetical protein B7Y47_03105 [Sphingomonas sp. 28-63-12]
MREKVAITINGFCFAKDIHDIGLDFRRRWKRQSHFSFETFPHRFKAAPNNGDVASIRLDKRK